MAITVDTVDVILASASPRRAELLAAAGFTYLVDPADVDETRRDAEDPAAYVTRLAQAKAAAVVPRHAPAVVILAADTTVVVDGDVLGKPEDAADATRMLSLLSGRTHHVLTAVVVRRADVERVAVVTTEVSFLELTPADIAWYVRTGEPDGKAGGYAIQGRAARFIDRIDGSWSNVVGLPISTVWRMVRTL
jgi:septum formation protein